MSKTKQALREKVSQTGKNLKGNLRRQREKLRTLIDIAEAAGWEDSDDPAERVAIESMQATLNTLTDATTATCHFDSLNEAGDE